MDAKEKEAVEKKMELDFHSVSPLASERKSEVCASGDERVVKLFPPGMSRRSSERERRNTATA